MEPTTDEFQGKATKMASGTTFGASIVKPTQQGSENNARPTATLDSPVLTPAVSHEDLNDSNKGTQPHTPFYQQTLTPPQPAHSKQGNQSREAISEKDIEAGPTTPLSRGDEDEPFTSKVSLDRNKECKMWPSRQTLIQERKAERKRKRDQKFCGGCGPVRDFWGRFTKRQKLIFKIVLALIIIGLAVAIAVSITVAVNGTVYVSEDKSQQIPETQ